MKSKYEKLIEAKNTLCDECAGDYHECEYCPVTFTMRDASKELLENFNIVVTEIQWDTDGNEALLEELPKRILIPTNKNITDDEDISDFITEEFGFCHYGFKINFIPIIKKHNVFVVGEASYTAQADEDKDRGFVLAVKNNCFVDEAFSERINIEDIDEVFES